jgi:hypothetical protein
LANIDFRLHLRRLRSFNNISGNYFTLTLFRKNRSSITGSNRDLKRAKLIGSDRSVERQFRRHSGMKRLVERFGKLITASFFIMAIGVIVFLLTIPLYSNFGLDTDIIGLIIFTIGLAICLIGIIRRKKLQGWMLAVLIILTILMCLPVLSLIVTLVIFLITGKPVGA